MFKRGANQNPPRGRVALKEWVQGHDMESEPILLCHFQGLSTLKRFAPPCLPSSLEGGGSGGGKTGHETQSDSTIASCFVLS